MHGAPNVDVYLAMGRARLAAREQLARQEKERQSVERRALILHEWKPLLDCIERSLPAEFGPYLVEPTDEPEGQPLVLDLTPLGLGPLGAYPDASKEEGVGWAPPRIMADEATGRNELHPPPPVCRHLVEYATCTFPEALALAEDAAQEVERRNALPVASAPGPAPDPYAPLAGQGGGCFPVLRIGRDRAAVHQGGAEDAAQFGLRYGAEGWLAEMAVHTFTLSDAGGGNLYAYLALIPVTPAKWRTVVGGGCHVN